MTPLIKVDTEKCNNCHSCIAVCPVKSCIDGSGGKVSVIADRCLGCGRCVHICASHARSINDDAEAFFEELDAQSPMVVIIPPSAVTVFDDIFRLIGFLKSSRVLAVFDVSFGAELAVKSYIEYARKEMPQIIISQSCPAVVNYCELYAPHLIKYLAPVHSPMLHTAIMIKNYFPALANAKIAALSPCAAKKREIEETGYVDFNVSLVRFKEILAQRCIDVNEFAPRDFDGPMAERAVSFSSPGGLKKTLVRDVPSISSKIRRIEGPLTVYKYLDDIPKMLEGGAAPLLIDCLSCSAGCNGGPCTGNFGLPIATLEAKIEARISEQKRRNKLAFGMNRIKGEVRRYWKPEIYNRSYTDCSENFSDYHKPTQKDLDVIYHKMKKTTESDFLNCAACGYWGCQGMAEAIFNKLNRVENCHHYLKKEISERLKEHQSILQYVRDGVFLMASNGIILPSYSRALEEIFRRDRLAGVHIMTVLSGFLRKEKLEEISEFIDKAFDVSLPDSELQKENPLWEVDALFANLDGGFDVRRMRFAIERIGDGKAIERLLVVVRDGGVVETESDNDITAVTDDKTAADGGVADEKNLIFRFDKIENNFNHFVKNEDLKAILFALAEKCFLFCSPADDKRGKESMSFDAYFKGGDAYVSCCYDGAEVNTDKVVALAVVNGLLAESEAASVSNKGKLNFFIRMAFSDIKDKLKAIRCRKILFSNKNGSCRLTLVLPKEVMQ
ncbi:MAG: 4Fe-4S binding protein [Spirochaetaceae bacterium]|jgi:Pyruvate/2-oxoacid:ferredoxin oxidoreductase delta subunit|nr:4Fe-4S binding protein [Spirochaetaceae bacterium]